ncbi:unnamed protein product [Mytilus edulis]|uniref:Uncharacterized protein n=1 Tax=Mytilus edulis TaxID=6550 RepID=A0A8S3VHD6_MYTED|nr:unnamed protein product [Mytilus edulis]
MFALECPSGSFRLNDDNDENCKICTYWFYGKKCTGKCLCSENERCHHVRGCVPRDNDTRSKTICEDELKQNIKNISSPIDCDNTSKGLLNSSRKDCRNDVNIVINLQSNHRSSRTSYSSNGKPAREIVDVDYLNPYTTLTDNWQKETHVYGDNTRKNTGNDVHLHSYTRTKPHWKKSVDFDIDCTNTDLEYTKDTESRSNSWCKTV